MTTIINSTFKLRIILLSAYEMFNFQIDKSQEYILIYAYQGCTDYNIKPNNKNFQWTQMYFWISKLSNYTFIFKICQLYHCLLKFKVTNLYFWIQLPFKGYISNYQFQVWPLRRVLPFFFSSIMLYYDKKMTLSVLPRQVEEYNTIGNQHIFCPVSVSLTKPFLSFLATEKNHVVLSFACKISW